MEKFLRVTNQSVSVIFYDIFVTVTVLIKGIRTLLNQMNRNRDYSDEKVIRFKY